MKKIRVNKPVRPVYPSPAALITSLNPDGKPNIITLAETFNVSISKPVILGLAIRKATYSHGCISACKEFVINLPTAAMLPQVDACGSVSGRDGFDKFVEFGLTSIPADEVGPPLIGECPVNLECKLLSATEVGDHDLFLGELVAMHVDEDKLTETQKMKIDELDMLTYAESGYYSKDGYLGQHGFSGGKV